MCAKWVRNGVSTYLKGYGSVLQFLLITLLPIMTGLRMRDMHFTYGALGSEKKEGGNCNVYAYPVRNSSRSRLAGDMGRGGG